MQKYLKQILIGLFLAITGARIVYQPDLIVLGVFAINALLMAFISKIEDVKSLELAKFEDTLKAMKDEIEALKIVSQMRRAPL